MQSGILQKNRCVLRRRLRVYTDECLSFISDTATHSGDKSLWMEVLGRLERRIEAQNNDVDGDEEEFDHQEDVGKADLLDLMLAGTAKGGHTELCEFAKSLGARNFEGMFASGVSGGHAHICRLALDWDRGCFHKEAFYGENDHPELLETIASWGYDVPLWRANT